MIYTAEEVLIMVQRSVAASTVRYDIVQFPGGRYGLLKPEEKEKAIQKHADTIGHVFYTPDESLRRVYVATRITSTSSGDPAEDARAIEMVLQKAQKFFPGHAIIQR